MKHYRYQIIIGGLIDEAWSNWLSNLEISWSPSGTTELCGEVADQAALHGLLQRIRDLGLTLIAVKPIEECQEAELLKGV